MVARTSHLPHMVASLLAVTVARTEAEKLGLFAARVSPTPRGWRKVRRKCGMTLCDQLGNLADELAGLQAPDGTLDQVAR
jgi:hypothetical protein